MIVRLCVFCTLLIITHHASAQDYANSVVATDFDYITDDDPSCFVCIEYKRRGYREMPDKTGPSPLVQEAFIFVAYFDDGTKTDFAIDTDFGTKDEAQFEALRYATRLGKLPTKLRSGVERLIVHKGHKETTAFGGHGAIILYSENATKRISTHDLEETLFHESVHAAWDETYAASEDWIRAQASDGKFVTQYAKQKPKGEDLAESALFAYTLVHHPDRIPAKDRQKIITDIPARIRFVETLIPKDKPIFYSVGPKYACDGSDKSFVVSQERYDRSMAEYRKSVRKMDETSRSNNVVCKLDLSLPGQMKDIVSNALMLGLDVDEPKVQSFLSNAEKRYDTGDALLVASAQHFNLEIPVLRKKVEEFRHVNCTHGELNEKSRTEK